MAVVLSSLSSGSGLGSASSSAVLSVVCFTIFWIAARIMVDVDKQGNGRSLLHATLCVLFNSMYMYSFDYTLVYFSFVYMVLDSIFIVLDSTDNYLLYLAHHIASIIVFIIFIIEPQLTQYFSILAVLCEITNIPQQLWLLCLKFEFSSSSKHILAFFKPFYIFVRFIIIPFTLISIMVASQFALCATMVNVISTGFFLASYDWISKIKIEA